MLKDGNASHGAHLVLRYSIMRAESAEIIAASSSVYNV